MHNARRQNCIERHYANAEIRGLPLENIYRLLYNRNLYLRAYGRLYSNQGAMTKGTTAETVDGMSLEKIDRIINALRYERFRWTPVRQGQHPQIKRDNPRPWAYRRGRTSCFRRSFGRFWKPYYEPQFSDRSPRFPARTGVPHRSEQRDHPHGPVSRWFVEGDIKGCFDNIDHDVLLSVLGENGSTTTDSCACSSTY